MSMSPDLSGARWIKSTYSGNGGANCVEWAPSYGPVGVIPVRDSKDPNGPVLVFTSAAWASFVEGVRAGAFGEV